MAKKSISAAEAGRKGGKTPTKKPKGLAALSAKRRKEIAQMGGKKSRRTKKHVEEAD